LGSGASLSGTTDFCISAWVKTTATTEGVIVQQRAASPGGFDGQYRFFMNADGTVHFFVYQGGFQFDFSTFTPINDGIARHCLFNALPTLVSSHAATEVAKINCQRTRRRNPHS
jgi:hypothetical protein